MPRQATSIGELRDRAQHRLPRMIFDFLDGAAGDEQTARANVAAFDHWRLRPAVLSATGPRCLTTRFWSRPAASPLVLAPLAFSGLLHPHGERDMAMAASACGIPNCLPLASLESFESIRRTAADAILWLQLYLLRDRDIVLDLLRRAEAASIEVIVLTVDVTVHGRRRRDLRNGFYGLPHVPARHWLDFVRHPRWLMGAVRTPRRFGNIARYTAGGTDADFFLRQVKQRAGWCDVDWLRRHWPGRLLLKGILQDDDALRAIDAGADGIIVSNHGGRQLDGCTSAIEALVDVASTVAGRVPVLFDSGIRSGEHVARALALGATGCMLGRAAGYGLAASGRMGVQNAVNVIASELDTCMALMGVTHPFDLGPSHLSAREAQYRRP